MSRSAAVVPLLMFALATPALADEPLTLRVDATDAARHLLHIQETIPVQPGANTLVYPKWIPGEHGPTGPVVEVASLFVNANGKRLAWQRDDADMYAIHVDVPKGTSALELQFDFTLATSTSGYSSAASATEHLLLLSWNQVLFYPAGRATDAVRVQGSVQLPAGWKHATALPVTSASGGKLEFGAVSLSTLVDSPVLAGLHFRSVDLSPHEGPSYSLDMAADGPEALAASDSLLAPYRRLPAEAQAWFGGWHHGPYHFLLTLSDHTSHFGLEHHASSDDRVAERTWLDPDLALAEAELMPHELSHSWNGKYRRPAGLATPDFQQPMKGELLWIYEGLTQFSGWVLAGRSGTRSGTQELEDLARKAAGIERRRGREWRPLTDTGTEAQLLYDARDEWANLRRSTDFYDEGVLIWLDADMTIRRKTNGQKSLEDFCHAFHGGRGDAELKPFTFDDVVKALNGVVPYDWATFLHDRVDKVQPHAPLAGLTDAGWQLAWSDTMSSVMKARESVDQNIDEGYSIGIEVNNAPGSAGAIVDIVPGSAADKAGIAPAMKLLAVNGRHWTKELLRSAIKATKDGQPLELLLDNGDFYRSFKLDYKGGLRYPVLRRDPTKPDLLVELLRPQAR